MSYHTVIKTCAIITDGLLISNGRGNLFVQLTSFHGKLGRKYWHHVVEVSALHTVALSVNEHTHTFASSPRYCNRHSAISKLSLRTSNMLTTDGQK